MVWKVIQVGDYLRRNDCFVASVTLRCINSTFTHIAQIHNECASVTQPSAKQMLPNEWRRSFAEYWKYFVARFNYVHAFGYNSAGSEWIWMKSGELRVYCSEPALTDFGRDPRRSESGRPCLEWRNDENQLFFVQPPTAADTTSLLTTSSSCCSHFVSLELISNLTTRYRTRC